jgi:hypothetical protein
LDAPIVAVAWLHVFAKTWRLGYHPWWAYLLLGMVTWVIYVADRLLDVSMSVPAANALGARHEFHNRHRRAFQIAATTVSVIAVVMLVTLMPLAIYTHLMTGAVFVVGFFGLSMLSAQQPEELPVVKNILAGTTFAFGVAVTAHVYRNDFGFTTLVSSREFLCFAVLCLLNISAIDLWSHSAKSHQEEIRAGDELALMLPLALLASAAVFCAIHDLYARPFYYAILSGAALLYALNRMRANLCRERLRALADMAMLVPVLVFIAASRA